MSVHLRLSNDNDYALIESFVRAYHAFDGIPDTSQGDAAAIRPLLGRSTLGRVWVICLGNQPVGYVAICFGYSIEFDGRDAFVDEMFILEPHRGKGFGASALALVKAEAAKLGVKALHLEVARGNERAQRLYRSAGFVARERFFLMSAPITSGDAP